MRPTNNNSVELGATLLEFAIVLPLVLLFIFSVIDLSRVVTNRIILSNSLRSAARYAALQSTSSNCLTAAQNRLISELSKFGMSDNLIQVSAVKDETSVITSPILRITASAQVRCLLCPILEGSMIFFRRDSTQFNFRAVATVPLENKNACNWPHS